MPAKATGTPIRAFFRRLFVVIGAIAVLVPGLPQKAFAFSEHSAFWWQTSDRFSNDLPFADTISENSESKVGYSAQKGYYNLSSFALLFGEGEQGYMPFPSITMVNGFCFVPGLLTGIGIGYEYLDCSLMPVFADVKYVFPERRHISFVSLKLGGGIPLKSAKAYPQYGYYDGATVYGGILIAPELGLLFPQKGKNALMVSLGYHHQEISFDDFANRSLENMRQKTYINFNRISLRLSYMFR